mmetsp:Transcript_27490/g.40609  ORF Transcript_27490/g.40609 Transcript_27490/m.40609 type:complete len:378 (+) Transcript_27490:63-1196(+)
MAVSSKTTFFIAAAILALSLQVSSATFPEDTTGGTAYYPSANRGQKTDRFPDPKKTVSNNHYASYQGQNTKKKGDNTYYHPHEGQEVSAHAFIPVTNKSSSTYSYPHPWQETEIRSPTPAASPEKLPTSRDIVKNSNAVASDRSGKTSHDRYYQQKVPTSKISSNRESNSKRVDSHKVTSKQQLYSASNDGNMDNNGKFNMKPANQKENLANYNAKHIKTYHKESQQLFGKHDGMYSNAGKRDDVFADSDSSAVEEISEAPSEIGNSNQVTSKDIKTGGKQKEHQQENAEQESASKKENQDTSGIRLHPAVEACGDFACRGTIVASLLIVLAVGLVVGRHCCREHRHDPEKPRMTFKKYKDIPVYEDQEVMTNVEVV